MGQKVRLPRVNRKNRCPICGQHDWCYFTEKGGVVCMRVPSDRTTSDGGFYHSLGGESKHTDFTPAPLDDAPIASLNIRDSVYRAFLNMPELALTTDDYRQFASWGFSVEMVKRRGYRRLPLAGRAKICKSLIEMGYKLEGVPGFYYKNDGYWSFTTGPGIIFPCLSPEMKLQGLQVRLDKPESDGKYKFFSSSGRSDGTGGTSSGAPWHLAKPVKMVRRIIYITEGYRKADYTAERMGVYCIGLPGVNSFSGVAEYVAGLGMPFAIAYDRDILHKYQVIYALKRLINELGVCEKKFLTRWEESQGKGIDDLLLAGGWPELVPITSKVITLINKKAAQLEKEYGQARKRLVAK